MTTQRTLFEERPTQSREERFALFLNANSWFVPLVIRMAREHKEKGNKRWSMKAIFELTRHQFRDGQQQYGLNNDFSALMARHVMEIATDLRGFFETR